MDLRLGAKVDAMVGAGGRAAGVRLHDGKVIACGLVVVGIGIVPAVEPLLRRGRKAATACRWTPTAVAACRTFRPGRLRPPRQGFR